MDQGKLLETFITEASELIEDLEVDLVALEESDDDELINKIFRAAHTIKGSAGVVGLAGLSNFTHSVEGILDQVREHQLKVTSELISVLLKAVDLLKVMVKEAAGDGEAADEHEVKLTLDELEQFMLNQTKAVTIVSGKKPVPQAQLTSQTPSEQKYTYYEINLSLAEDILETGTDPLMLLRELEDLGEIVEVSIDPTRVPDLHTLDVYKLYLSWRLVLKTSEPVSRIENVFVFVKDNSKISIEDVSKFFKDGVDIRAADMKLGEILAEDGLVTSNDIEEALSQQPKIGELLVKSGKVTEEALRAALDKQHKSREAQKTTTIRVDTDKLDKLVNLVGEMVIAVARVDQQYFTHGNENRRTGQGAMESLERICRDLQEQVMRVRMVSVEGLFSRFHRIVRDLATDLDKSVHLELSGVETELDKNVIEQLSDPLKHLIRNAIDHGIEVPKERAEAGKPEAATVKLSAYQQGGNIIIEISDDGRGINHQSVLAKAIEKGLVGPADTPSEREIYRFMFMPGFSTAKEVTEVSGRGVGLDVVNKNVEDLHGAIEVISAVGKGTTFRIKLPLTLAIIDGMMVRVGQEVLTIPLLSIIESVRPDREAVKTIGAKGEVIDARGEYLPLVRLHQVFDIETDKTEPAEALVVIVESSARRFGMLVDDVLGQQQAVIKSLDKNFRKVDGASGATILGDGAVSLIVDIHGLEKMAFRTHENLQLAG